MFNRAQIRVANERACRAMNVDELDKENEAHKEAFRDELRRIAVQFFVDLAVKQGKVVVDGVNEKGEVVYRRVIPDESR